MASKHVVLTRKAAMTLGALHGFIKPKLAQDAKLPNLVPILAKLTSKNFTQQKPILLKGVTAALDGKLAQDASAEGLAALLDALESEKAMDDPLPLQTEPNAGMPAGLEDKSMDDDGPDASSHEAIKAFLQDKLSPEDMASIEQILSGEVGDAEPEDVPEASPGSKKASEEGEDEDMDEKDKKTAKDRRGGAKDEPPPFKGKPEVGGGMSQDSVNAAIRKAVEAERASAKAIREAERFVQPWVGQIAIACDTAEEVYASALKACGMTDLKGLHPSGYKALLERLPVPGSQKPAAQAMDSASVSDFAKRFPEAARIKVY